MTKKEMLNFIKTTNLVVDFDYNYLMKRTKKQIEELYNHCKKVIENR